MPRPATAPPRPAPHAPTAATPMAFVRAIVQAYAQRGMDASAVLRLAQITPSDIARPQGRITALQMEQLSDGAMRELNDEALGWFGRRLPWGSYGMLARASISAPHLGLALQRWCRHHGLLTDDIALHLSSDGATATLAITEHRDLDTLREFCLVSMLRNALGLACWLIDSRLPLQGADFPFAPPPHQAAYPLLFAGPIAFRAPQAALRFDARYLAMPLQRDENALRTMLQRALQAAYPLLFAGPIAFRAPQAALRFDARYLAMPLQRDENALRTMLQRALPLTVRQYRRDRLLVQRVRQALAAEPGAMQGAHALAERLHLSPRTLHRQLKEEGASLQALKDEVRQHRAIEWLHRTDRPIKQVAQAAGFLNEKSFIRAFRGWTGQSPAAFRRAARLAGGG